jgi:pyruvate ferredoxin oxidoreductase alpha subunit
VSKAVAVLGGGPYSYFRYETHLAQRNALAVYDEVAGEFADRFGREHPAVESYRCEDAEVIFLMIGSFATRAKDAVDQLRAAGRSVGLLRPRVLRPYPGEALRRHLAGKRAVAVIDQNLSMGMGGVLHSELAACLYGVPDAPPVLASFIGGLGGRDIPPEEFYEMAHETFEAAEKGRSPEPRLLYTEEELREVRKLQSIAAHERQGAGS